MTPPPFVATFLLAGCPSTPAPPEGPSDALDTASETTAPSDTAMDTLPPSDTAPETPPSGDAVVSTRTDLAPWLGFDITLDATPTARLACDSVSDPRERHARNVESGFHSLPGLLAGHRYACRLEARGAVLWEALAETPPLPQGLPDLVVSQTGHAELQDGWLVFNQWGDGDIHRALIVDGDGQIRWHRALDAARGGVTVTWDGTYLVAGGRDLPPSQFDLDGTQLYRGTELDGEFVYYHHESRRVVLEGVPAILALTSTELPPELRTHEPAQLGFQIEVHDPATDTILWQYDVADHMEDWGVPDDIADPWHTNAVTWEPDGHLWISARGTNTLTRIEQATGTPTHVLGAQGTVQLLDRDGQALPLSAWFSGQHGPHQAGDRLFLLDNGRPSRGSSRAVEYRLDLEAHEATEVWSWTEPGWVEPYYGNVEPLPGGHILVASGHCLQCEGSGGADRSAFVVEVDPTTNDVRWRLDLVTAGTSLFRAQYVAPCDLFHHVGRCPEAE